MGCVASAPCAPRSVTTAGTARRGAGPTWLVGVPGGGTLVHLICLRCNRANASDAKFCGECGAGLLRKFCGRCRAINDAESHFCQSCGEVLPAAPSAPPVLPMVPPAVVPQLTEIYDEFDPAPNPVAVETVLDSRVPTPAGPPTVVDPPLPLDVSPGMVPSTSRPAQRAVLFGFVGGAAVLLALALWSRGEHTAELKTDAIAAIAPAVTPPAQGPEVAAPVTAPGPVLDRAPPPQPAASAASVPAPAVAGLTAPAPRRLSPEAQIAAQPPAAGPPTRPLNARTPSVVRAAPPLSVVADCTPQADALGLCAPGAKVAEKPGSK